MGQVGAERDLKTTGVALVNQLHVYLRSLQTYQSNNVMVVNALKDLMDTLEAWFQDGAGALQLQLLPGESFINNSLLPIPLKDFPRVEELTGMLRALDVGEVTFEPGVSQETLVKFGEAFSESTHKSNSLLSHSFVGISTAELDPTGVGGSRGEAYRMCVWLFSGLLNGLDGLAHIYEEGRTPSLAPFMRHTRLMADLFSERATVFQHLCLSRPENDGDEITHLHACRTAIGVALARHMGLSRAGMMTFGLVTVVDRISRGTEPDEMFSFMSQFHSLSDLAPGVMAGLRGLEKARRGEDASSVAKLLFLIENFVNLVHGGDTVTLEEVTDALEEAGHEAVQIKLLFDWLGDPPLGALVEHPSHGTCLIFDRGENGETLRLRPVYHGAMDEPVEVDGLPDDVEIWFGGERDYDYEFDY